MGDFDDWLKYAWEVSDWDSLLTTLRVAKWTCGRGIGHNFDCEKDLQAGIFASKNAWLLEALGILLGLVALASFITCIYVKSTPDQTREWFEKQKDLRLERRSSSSDDS